MTIRSIREDGRHYLYPPTEQQQQEQETNNENNENKVPLLYHTPVYRESSVIDHIDYVLYPYRNVSELSRNPNTPLLLITPMKTCKSYYMYLSIPTYHLVITGFIGSVSLYKRLDDSYHLLYVMFFSC